MKFANIITRLWTEPWLIIPTAHAKICEIVEAHIDGRAHAVGGIASDFGEPDSKEFGYEQVGNLAVIPVQGVIGQHVGAIEKSSGVTDVADISATLDKALAAQDIEGIMLDVNSPGGSLTGVPELSKAIARAAGIKPVAAYTDSLMASAAYWLAAGADVIVASESAQIGSIGVYMPIMDDSRAMDMQGYRMELFKRGKHKGIGISGTTLTDESREMLQDRVNQIYGWFTDHVRAFRADAPDEAMEGQTFFAEAAKVNDLVDIVGSRDQAMRELSEMAEENKPEDK